MFEPPTDARSTERTIRCAPRWAWAVIDALLWEEGHGTENVAEAAREVVCAGCDKVKD